MPWTLKKYKNNKLMLSVYNRCCFKFRVVLSLILFKSFINRHENFFTQILSDIIYYSNILIQKNNFLIPYFTKSSFNFTKVTKTKEK